MKRFLAVAAVVLCLAVLASWAGDASRAAEHRPARRSVVDDVAALRARLAAPRDYVAEHMREIQARQAAEERAAKALDNEARTLAIAMRAHLARTAPGAEDRLARVLDVDGLARFLVTEVDRRHQAGDWLPLSRQKAPTFLAAVSYFESSWRWNDSRIRGSRGERGAWQVGDYGVRKSGHTGREVSASPVAALDAALWVMAECARKCGETPAERWFGAYATAGRCGGAPDVVAPRFVLARRLAQ